MAFYTLEPFGPLRWAQLAATVCIACLSPWRKKNAAALTLADVFPELGEGRKKPTRAMMLAKVRAWAAQAAKQAFTGLR